MATLISSIKNSKYSTVLSIHSLLLLAIFLVAFTTRVLAITIPVNTDEVSWINRGLLFITNLLKGDLDKTFLFHHPGLTNMWLMGSSLLVNCTLHKLFPTLFGLNAGAHVNACLERLIALPSPPIQMWILPRLLQAVITSLCMVGTFVLAQRLFGRAIALVGISLLVLEPFFLAYQRYLTTDALQTDFCILSLLLFLLYLRDGDRRLLIGSGITMGLACAGKSTALLCIPAMGVWLVFIPYRPLPMCPAIAIPLRQHGYFPHPPCPLKLPCRLSRYAATS